MLPYRRIVEPGQYLVIESWETDRYYHVDFIPKGERGHDCAQFILFGARNAPLEDLLHRLSYQAKDGLLRHWNIKRGAILRLDNLERLPLDPMFIGRREALEPEEYAKFTDFVLNLF